LRAAHGSWDLEVRHLEVWLYRAARCAWIAQGSSLAELSSKWIFERDPVFEAEVRRIAEVFGLGRLELYFDRTERDLT
jgi:hypothetical protein